MATTVELSQLCERLRCNDPSLTLMNLSSRNIGNTGAIAIARALETNTRCIILFLDNNHLSNSAAVAFSRVLANPHCHLEQLFLSYNNVEDEGAVALAQAIRCNQTLKTLKITDNRIGKLGGNAMAEACSINSTLRVLNLDGNRIQDPEAFALSLRSNQSLRSLYLRYNQCETKNIDCFIDLLQNHNRTLQDLCLEEEEPKDKDAASFRRKAQDTIQFWLELNRSGRQFWDRDVCFPGRSCMPDLLSRKNLSSNPRVLFTFLQMRPELLITSTDSKENHNNK